MKNLIYSFRNLSIDNNGKYLLQIVKNRELSRIYHSHDFYELIYIMSGTCKHKVQSTTYPMQYGDFVILYPGVSHSFTEQSDNLILLALSISKYEFESFISAYEIKPEKFNNINFYHTELLLRTTEWIKECGEFSSDKYKIKILLSHFINRLLENSFAKNNDIPDRLRIALIKMKEDENIFEGIPALIRLSGYSHAQLARLIKKHTGKTLHEYTKNLKLQKAYSKLLYDKDCPEKVAYDVGYMSTSHFIRIFKEEYGLSPAQVRKKKTANTI